MKPRHIALALMVAVIWGVNFVVIRIGLDRFPPLLLLAMRFALSGLPALFVKRPSVSWPRMLVLGGFLFAGQFGLMFVGIARGTPPGLASIVLQAQALFTMAAAAVLLREVPSVRQIGGAALSIGGLGLILMTVGGDVPLTGVLLVLGAAFSWAIGTVLLRAAGRVDMFAVIVWLSLIPPLPFLAASFVFEGSSTIAAALGRFSLADAGVLLYLAVLSNIVGYGVWGFLLRLYPAGTVAPFALLVPIFGAITSALVFGEHFGPLRLGGSVLVMLGLAIGVLPVSRLRAWWTRPPAQEVSQISH